MIAVLVRSAPVFALLLAMALLVPRINAEAGPPETVFVLLDPSKPDLEIDAEVIPAGDGEWLLRMEIDGFAFSETCAVVETGKPIGHAHVYEGGKKIAAAYQPILSLGKLSPGEHALRIMLRAQDHRALVGASGLIEREIRIIVG
ncbi:MAG: hypothetical protein ACR2QJ_07250 [Geminicoccaceae bacterium]